jgi:hypothetical protein
LLVSPTEPPAALGADWLDTLGRREGTVFMRVILPQHDVPAYTVIQVERRAPELELARI